MRIPIKLLIGNVPEPTGSETWGDIIDNWEAYALNWNATSSLGVDPGQAPVLDMFGDESVSIKSVVKDLSDPSKLFTEYSRSFTIPASKKNNRIFKHYNNIDITNGLDSRELLPVKILMNNSTYKEGNIQIESVRMDKGVASSYKINFIGKLSELARNMGQDRLTVLDFSALDDSSFSAEDALSSNTLGELIFPLSSRSDRFIYDTDTAVKNVENAKNIAYVNSTVADGYGIGENDVIGALKVGTIISKIESTYGFTFTGALKNDYISNLYLWLHQTDKSREGEINSAFADDFSYDTNSLSGISLNDNTISFSGYASPTYNRYLIKAYGTFTGEAVVKLRRNGIQVASVEVTNNYTTELVIPNNPGNYTVLVEHNGSQTIPVKVQITHQTYEPEEQFLSEGWYDEESILISGSASVGSAGKMIIADNLPKMKIIDFLSSIFKMFNVIAEIDSELNITTKHYDHFMSEGSLKDVSKYISVDRYDVGRPNLYSSMQMEFADPKVAMELGYLAVNGQQYGELSYELIGNTGVRLSGNEYKLKLENQRVPVEPLTNLATGSVTKVIYTQFADLKSAEQNIKPMFTYATSILVPQGDVSGRIAFTTNTTVSEIITYVQPSNTYVPSGAIPSRTNAEVGLYFGEELNEYNVSDTIGGIGLWSSFYRGTTAMMFDEDKRSVKFTGELPQGLIIDLKLSDTLLINNSFYNINSIDTNYLTGKSKLDLTLVGRSRLDQFNPANRVISNNSTSAILYITYMSTSGEITTASIATSSTLTTAMVGTVLGRSHSDYTVALA